MVLKLKFLALKKGVSKKNTLVSKVPDCLTNVIIMSSFSKKYCTLYLCKKIVCIEKKG